MFILIILKIYQNLINLQASCGIYDRNLLHFDSLNLITEVEMCLLIGFHPINLFLLPDCLRHYLIYTSLKSQSRNITMK